MNGIKLDIFPFIPAKQKQCPFGRLVAAPTGQRYKEAAKNACGFNKS